MERREITKSRTFRKGVDYGELVDFVLNNDFVEINDYQPEGSDSGLLYPTDTVQELKHKYIVTIRKISDSQTP